MSSLSNFDKLYGKNITIALHSKHIEYILKLNSHPYFTWPSNGTLILAKEGDYYSFKKLFEFMKYNNLKQFTWHPNTLDACIKYCNQRLVTLLARNGYLITHENVIHIISKGLTNTLDAVLEFLPFDIRIDTDLQKYAIKNKHFKLFKLLTDIQHKVNPNAIYDIIKYKLDYFFDYVIEKEQKYNNFEVLKTNINIVNHAIACNNSYIIEKCISYNFLMPPNTVEYILMNDAYNVLNLFLKNNYKITDNNIRVAVSSNSFYCVKILHECRVKEGGKIWPDDILTCAIDTEYSIRSNSSLWYNKKLNENPFYCIKYAYDNGCIVPDNFLYKLNELIKIYNLNELLSPFIIDWLNQLNSKTQNTRQNKLIFVLEELLKAI
jgi:hypothetical protein